MPLAFQGSDASCGVNKANVAVANLNAPRNNYKNDLLSIVNQLAYTAQLNQLALQGRPQRAKPYFQRGWA